MEWQPFMVLITVTRNTINKHTRIGKIRSKNSTDGSFVHPSNRPSFHPAIRLPGLMSGKILADKIMAPNEGFKITHGMMSAP
jgi:hypothetical protein